MTAEHCIEHNCFTRKSTTWSSLLLLVMVHLGRLKATDQAFWMLLSDIVMSFYLDYSFFGLVCLKDLNTISIIRVRS